MRKLSLRSHPVLQFERLTLLALLLAAVMGVTAVTHAQNTPTPGMATLTGTAYRLVDQTIVDGVVVDETEEPISDGRIAIPELGIDMPLAADGTFALSNLPVSADPDNPTEVTVVFTAPGLGSYTYLHLRLFPGTVGPILTPQLIDTPRVNDRSRAHTDDDGMRALPQTKNTCGRPREAGEVAILGQTDPPVDHGTVRIPELDLTSEIVGGCFEFRNLTLPQDPMLVSFEIRVESYRPATWAHYIVLSTRNRPNFTPRLEPGDEPKLIDPCPALLATPQMELSASQSRQAQLCAQLPATGTLPETGGGGPAADSGLPVAPVLALAGAALILAGAATRHVRRAN